FINGQHVFALSHAINGKAEISSMEGDAIGELTADGEPGRSTNDNKGVAAPIQILARYHDDRVRAGLAKVRHVDFARPDHGTSSMRPAAFRRATALIAP